MEKKNYRILIFAIVLFLIIYQFVGDLNFIRPIFVIGSVVWFIFAIYALYEYKTNPTLCKVCNKNKTMIPLDTYKAQFLIEKRDLKIPDEEHLNTDQYLTNIMKSICKSCQFVGIGKHGFFRSNLYLGISLVVLGFILVNLKLGLESLFGYLNLIIALVFLYIGTTNIINSSKTGNICPNCNKKDLVLIKTKEAQELIKENNITIPSKSLD